MKKSLYMAVIVLLSLFAASCKPAYVLDVDFALNRTDLRFKNTEAQSYFMVYSRSGWTVAFEQEVSWASLGKTAGNGNEQVNVFCQANPGVSRGVNIIVTNADGRTKMIYLSQNAGMDNPTYKPEDETVDLFSSQVSPVISITTNLDEASVAGATISVDCSGSETPWIRNVKADMESVSFDVDPFDGSGSRQGTVLISFASAKWEENPCRCAITVNQTDQTPAISLQPLFDLDPAGDVPTDIEVQTNWNPKYYDYVIGHEFSDDSWIAEHSYDGKKTISVRALENDGKTTRTTTMTCRVMDRGGNMLQGGAELSASTTLSQAVAPKPLTPVYLTEGGRYANSFLIETTDTTLYKVDLKKVDGTAIENAVGAKVIWQTAEDLIGSTYIKDEQLYFTQSVGKVGNALIGVTDASGKTLWSFHVWISATKVNTASFGGLIFMDRNLGALKATAPEGVETDAAGMHYEWGRKDPFPPVEGFTPSGNRDHMPVYPANAITFVTAQDGKPLSYTIENPAAYLWGSAGSGKEDWIDVQDADLWGGKSGVKSNADPCPWGWEVPSETQMTDVLNKMKAVSGLTHYGMEFSDDEGGKQYFPCPGYYRRTVNASSQLCNVSTFGWLWTRTSGTYNNAYVGGRRLQIHNTVANRTFATQPNRWGANIRCVKQDK